MNGGKNMDITKYLTNKDIQLSNEDFNLEKLEKDLRKGYVLESDKENAIKEAISNNSKESTSKYVELENKYNELEKSYNSLQERDTNHTKTISGLNLRMNLMKEGFPSDKLDEVANLRSSMFAEETDDSKAIGMIKEKFGATYFPKTESTVEVPNEQPLVQGKVENHEINVTRKTSIKDLLK